MTPPFEARLFPAGRVATERGRTMPDWPAIRLSVLSRNTAGSAPGPRGGRRLSRHGTRPMAPTI